MSCVPRAALTRPFALHRRVLEISPTIADSHREIGVILQAQNRHAEALAAFRAARPCPTPISSSTPRPPPRSSPTGLRRSDPGRPHRARGIPRRASTPPWLTLIAAYAQIGETDPQSADIARAELARYFATAQPIRSPRRTPQGRRPRRPARPHRLRRAGLPDE
jgi:hypothetical protein